MATLISPGVDVKILHEDFYVSGNAATVPLIFIATEDEKTQADGVTPALGTYENNVLRTVTSLKQAADLYGIPKFRESVDGAPHHGDSRNEYGLDALFKVLEVSRRAYVIRANVNLNDNLVDTKAAWTAKIADAADYLSVLAAEYIAQYNEVNGLYPADAGYKTTIDKATFTALAGEALTDVFASYSFSKDAFAVAFLTDHTTPQPAYLEVVFDSGAGLVTGTDIVGLDVDVQYGAQVEVVSTGGTAVHNLYVNGQDVVTFDDLIAAINTVLAGDAVASLVQGRIRITSDLAGATSEVTLVVDGPTGRQPLFASLNLFDRVADPVLGKGVQSLDIYNTDYTSVTGGYEGLGSLVADWAAGTVVGFEDEFLPSEAEGLLLAAAGDFDDTKEFRTLTSLGINDATRRQAIVRALQAAINNPYSNARAEGFEYNLAVAPGYPECGDELLRLGQDMFEEVFIIGETPFDKPPTGPSSIANWAVGTGRTTSDSIAYYYGHGITSNIDGADILTSAGTTALRTLAYSDANSEGEWIAPAGTTRGVCPHLSDVGYVSGALGGPTTFVPEWLDNGTRDELYEYPKCINPISFIPGRGFLVMGQRTTSPVAQSTDRVNVSRLVKYIKRQLRKSLFAYTFEPNDEITRRNIKAATDSFLATLIDRRALYDFATICDRENNTDQTIDNNELYIDIAIKPVKAVEFIYARVRIVRTGANIGTKKSLV